MLNGFLLENKLSQYRQSQAEESRHARGLRYRRRSRDQLVDNYRHRVEHFISTVRESCKFE